MKTTPALALLANLVASPALATPEFNGGCSLEMDGLTLNLAECEAKNPEERRQLWEVIQTERDHLAAWLGESSLGQGALSIPIQVQLNAEIPGGLVRWYTPAKTTDDSRCQTVTRGELLLGSLEASLVNHELVHLLVQPPCVSSRATQEGHAHAITSLIHPNNAEPTEISDRLDNRGYRALWEQGWDFDPFLLYLQTQTHHAPIPNENFENLLHYQWGRLWKEWEAKNPGFLKKFYEKVSDLKKTGHSHLDKETILQWAESLTPGFLKWMERKAKPLKDLGSDGSHKVQKAIRVNEQETDIIQYRMTTLPLPNASGQASYWAVIPSTQGTLTAWEAAPLGQDGYQGRDLFELREEDLNRFFLIIQQKSNAQILGWSIGDQTLYY